MYSRCKKAAEEILLSFMEKYDIPICIIRPFSITGVGEQKQHLIPTLIDAAFTGNQVNFSPDPTHDFIDVVDVVDGILSLSRNGARGIFELGNGKKYTNAEVLDIVERVTGRNIHVNVVHSLRQYDTDNWVSTNFKARGYGWLPRISLESSIEAMVHTYAIK
jgi:nucleoside-diphosphate-sugar epimerase